MPYAGAFNVVRVPVWGPAYNVPLTMPRSEWARHLSVAQRRTWHLASDCGPQLQCADGSAARPPSAPACGGSDRSRSASSGRRLRSSQLRSRPPCTSPLHEARPPSGCVAHAMEWLPVDLMDVRIAHVENLPDGQVKLSFSTPRHAKHASRPSSRRSERGEASPNTIVLKQATRFLPPVQSFESDSQSRPSSAASQIALRLRRQQLHVPEARALLERIERELWHPVETIVHALEAQQWGEKRRLPLQSEALPAQLLKKAECFQSVCRRGGALANWSNSYRSLGQMIEEEIRLLKGLTASAKGVPDKQMRLLRELAVSLDAINTTQQIAHRLDR
ncbi:hypothetical protein AB1Y20_020113 [Prymnesium parvum]|uniref:Uncharacterized protein n=1 Tax=Prymnesium parvum TaxID=97485 RepID=A0AB34JWD2_PRYPA